MGSAGTEPTREGEREAVRERVAQSIADAIKAWPTADGSPVKDLFVADAALDALGLEQVGWWLCEPLGDKWSFMALDDERRCSGCQPVYRLSLSDSEPING